MILQKFERYSYVIDNIKRIYDVSKLEVLKIEYDKDENTFQGFIRVKHVYDLR